MRPRQSWLGMSVGFVVVAMASGASAQTALSGLVSSSEEGPMEGVVVSAKKEGSTITATVVTDEKGHYGFPAAAGTGELRNLDPGIGYKLDGPKRWISRPANPKADLKLVKVKNLVNQLSNGEWLLSLPGPDNRRPTYELHGLSHAAACLHSTHDAESSSRSSSGWSVIRRAARPPIRNRFFRDRAATALQ